MKINFKSSDSYTGRILQSIKFNLYKADFVTTDASNRMNVWFYFKISVWFFYLLCGEILSFGIFIWWS